jgi:tripeptide aminopeptidase
MPASSRSEASESSPAVAEIAHLATLAEVRSGLAWMRAQEAQFETWQLEMAQVPAPPFGEGERGRWVADRFRKLGLKDVQVDEAGNVLGIYPGTGKRYVSVSAHIDTVFPAGTALNIRRHGSRLYGPGISDNGAGVTAMLAVAGALQVSDLPLSSPVVFIGNVGEEGEGNLRGMRQIFTSARWKDTIHSSLVLDGAGSDTIVAEALGSRRFEVIVRGPGGHSWSDFGTSNPIVALARAINTFAQTPVPASPKTTFNVGIIQGGTSVNSIPEAASMRVDIRSTSMREIERLEIALRRELEKAVDQESRANDSRSQAHRRSGALTYEIVEIGNRPAGELPADAKILKIIRAVDSYIGNAAQIQRASTDANVPLSMGREAIAIGGGGIGGGAHTLQEWFDCRGRETGLKRILLTVLALAGVEKSAV